MNIIELVIINLFCLLKFRYKNKKLIMKYYYLAMTQQDFLKNQVIEEVIRERTNYYINRKDCLNFWVVMSPDFLNHIEIKEKIFRTNFFFQKKNEIENQNKLYTACIITTDYDYLLWLKLRLGYFENINENEISLNTSLRSDGIFGIFDLKLSNTPFSNPKNNINPEILVNNYKTILTTSLSI
jgi:hypothetical protein